MAPSTVSMAGCLSPHLRDLAGGGDESELSRSQQGGRASLIASQNRWATPSKPQEPALPLASGLK
ncbi:hypothetical protein ACRRTK_003761 [Alexandromys fortis]